MKLSKRQKKVFELLCDGLTVNEIAEKMHISTVTVHTHLIKMYKKFNVNRKYQLLSIEIKRLQMYEKMWNNLKERLKNVG